MNVPLPAGCGDAEYTEIYKKKMPEIKKIFNPDIVFVSAGYDILFSDPIAGMNVTLEGISSIVDYILKAFEELPVIFVLEGGYDVSGLAMSVSTSLEKLLKI